MVSGLTGLKKSLPSLYAAEIGEQPVACAPCTTGLVSLARPSRINS